MGGESPPCPGLRREPLSLLGGVSCVTSSCPQTVVQRGLVARAQQLLANSSALEEAVLGQQQKLDLSECQASSGTPGLWATSV